MAFCGPQAWEPADHLRRHLDALHSRHCRRGTFKEKQGRPRLYDEGPRRPTWQKQTASFWFIAVWEEIEGALPALNLVLVAGYVLRSGSR